MSWSSFANVLCSLANKMRSLANVLHYDANGFHSLAKAVLCLSSEMKLIEFYVDLGMKYKDTVLLLRIKLTLRSIFLV